MKFENSFYGADGRLRSGWRFAIFLVAFFFSGFFFANLANIVVNQFQLKGGPSYLVGSIASLIPAILVGWLCGKYLEDLPFRALGVWFTEDWWKRLLFGLMIGGFSLGLSIIIAVIFGGLSFRINPNLESSGVMLSLIWSLAIFAVAGAFEEVLFRGYILQTFFRNQLPWFALVLTSILFASVHLGNPSATAFSIFNTFTAGIWFAVGYWKTRDLWLPFGMHVTWNWLQGFVLGVEVSGLRDIITSPLLKEIDNGPAWLTGDNYGIEGGIVTTIALIVSTIVIYYIPFGNRRSEPTA